MKIHSTHLCISEIWRIDRQAYRLLTFFGAVALCIMTCTSVNAQSRLFARSSASPTASTSMVRNGLFINGDKSYPVVNTAAFRTAADIGTPESGSIAQVGFGGACSSCGTSCGGSCDNSYSSCGTCGTNCGGSYRSCNQYRDPCAPCNPYCYVAVEALYMQREGHRQLSASPDFGMSTFDYEWAPRITIGSVPDCVQGYEASFMGVLEWDMFGAAADPAFGLGTLLLPVLPVTAADVSAFSNANFQSQAYEAKLWSAEVNKTLVGWEVAKLLTGFRYISYEEEYAYYSQNLTEAGLLFSKADNQMLGLQAGMDLLYPISKHAYTDFRTRLGLFANYMESNVLLDNAGVRLLSTADDKWKLAGMFELGAGVRYQVGPMLSFRAGVELSYLTRVATAADQVPGGLIGPTTGLSTRTRDDVLFTGASFGAELTY